MDVYRTNCLLSVQPGPQASATITSNSEIGSIKILVDMLPGVLVGSMYRVLDLRAVMIVE